MYTFKYVLEEVIKDLIKDIKYSLYDTLRSSISIYIENKIQAK